MKTNKLSILSLLASLALNASVYSADFNASLLSPLYYTDETTAVTDAVVSFGYFNGLDVAAVSSGVNAANNLMAYYETGFSELYRANIVGGALNYNVSGNKPTLLDQGAGQDMWARVSAGSGSTWFNGLYVLADTKASTYWKWSSSDLADSIINSFFFDTKVAGETSPEDFSIVSQAVLSGSQSDDKLTLSAITTTTAVPEPSSMSLMIFGATALVALRRLRKTV
jgi:hypothetical protein